MTYGKFKLVKTFETCCDECGNWTTTTLGTAPGTVDRIERWLAQNGWRVINGEVLCKDCVELSSRGRKICNLRVVRKAKGLTLQACADLLGSHIRTISGWEQGRHAPADATWIAARLGVPVEELYADPA